MEEGKRERLGLSREKEVGGSECDFRNARRQMLLIQRCTLRVLLPHHIAQSGGPSYPQHQPSEQATLRDCSAQEPPPRLLQSTICSTTARQERYTKFVISFEAE